MARHHGYYLSSVPQAHVACGVASGARVQFPYVLIVCVAVGRPVAVDLPFLLGLIDTRRADPPGGEKILSLVGQRKQSACWAHVGGAVALAYGWWSGGREGPFGDDTVNKRAARRRMARAWWSERESEADVGLPKVMHNVGTWSCYPRRVDGLPSGALSPLWVS